MSPIFGPQKLMNTIHKYSRNTLKIGKNCPQYVPNRQKRGFFLRKNLNFDGARGRTWTGTVFLPRDFKANRQKNQLFSGNKIKCENGAKSHKNQ